MVAIRFLCLLAGAYSVVSSALIAHESDTRYVDVHETRDTDLGAHEWTYNLTKDWPGNVPWGSM